jgi:hypothetical protein
MLGYEAPAEAVDAVHARVAVRHVRAATRRYDTCRYDTRRYDTGPGRLP